MRKARQVYPERNFYVGTHCSICSWLAPSCYSRQLGLLCSETKSLDMLCESQEK